jgi:hypothetical protein
MPHIAKSLVKRQAPFPHAVLLLCFSFGIRRFYFTGQAALVSAWKSGAFAAGTPPIPAPLGASAPLSPIPPAAASGMDSVARGVKPARSLQKGSAIFLVQLGRQVHQESGVGWGDDVTGKFGFSEPHAEGCAGAVETAGERLEGASRLLVADAAGSGRRLTTASKIINGRPGASRIKTAGRKPPRDSSNPPPPARLRKRHAGASRHASHFQVIFRERSPAKASATRSKRIRFRV